MKKVSGKLSDAEIKIKAFKPADTSQHFKDLMQLDERITELEHENEARAKIPLSNQESARGH